MNVLLFAILIMVLVATPFVMGIYYEYKKSKNGPIEAGIAGMICVFLALVLTAITFNGTLSSLNSNTTYKVERVVEVNDKHAILYARTSEWSAKFYYYGVACSDLRDGCPSMDAWPKHFKRIKDGDKFVIVELRTIKNNGS